MKQAFIVAAFLVLIVPAAGCTPYSQVSGADTLTTGIDSVANINKVSEPGADSGRYASILNSYYAALDTPAWSYFQHKSVTRWVKEAPVTIEDPQWHYDSFTKIEILDHDFAVSRPEEQLYCCTFSDGSDRYGYIIVAYQEDGPALSQWGVTETKPYRYDLKANFDGIMAGLENTDIDFSTATASRVYFFDRDNKRADQVIRFTDAKGDNYLYYFGDETFEIEKYELH